MGSTGALTFQEVNDEDFSSEPEYLVPTGRIVLIGERCKLHQVFRSKRTIHGTLKLKPSGVEYFPGPRENIERISNI